MHGVTPRRRTDRRAQWEFLLSHSSRETMWVLGSRLAEVSIWGGDNGGVPSGYIKQSGFFLGQILVVDLTWVCAGWRMR